MSEHQVETGQMDEAKEVLDGELLRGRTTQADVDE
jgi:hypothetical protein